MTFYLKIKSFSCTVCLNQLYVNFNRRRPAWTDRILYRVNKDNYEHIKLEVKQLFYTNDENSLISDHRPVISCFEAKVCHLDYLIF